MEQDWARPVVHWAINAKDPARLRDFYATLFNWDITTQGPVLNIPPGVGAPEPAIAGHIGHSERPGVVLYIQVRDIRASQARAVELGGQALRPPFDIPAGPTIADIADPEGNVITLVQQ